MRYHPGRNYFLYGIAVIIGLGVVVSILLLWFGLGSKEPVQDTKSGLENTEESLLPTVATNGSLSLTATVVLTITEIPLSPIKKAVPPTVSAPLYVLAQHSKTVLEVWQFLPENDGRWSRLYTVTYPLDKSGEVAVPTQEIERMKNYLAAQSPPIELPDGPLFERYPIYLALSPTIKRLAFVEWASVFVTNSQEGFFGVVYTGDLMLETNQSQIFFQSPARVFINELDYLVSLTDPIWSPDGRYYSVQHNFIHQDSSPLIVNVNTGVVQRLESAANLFGPLAWSPDSTTVFLYLYRSGFDSSGGIIRLCEIALLNCRDVELDGIWIDPRGADWSPQRNQIVFAGANEDFRRSPSPPPFNLYLFDPETEAIHKVLDNFNRSLANPVWSPDGRSIAVEYNTEGVVASPNTIVIVEPDDGQVIAEIPIKGCDWQWEQSSQAIMQLPCGRMENHSLVVFNIFDASSQQIELPFELSLKRRLGFKNLKLP